MLETIPFQTSTPSRGVGLRRRRACSSSPATRPTPRHAATAAPSRDVARTPSDARETRCLTTRSASRPAPRTSIELKECRKGKPDEVEAGSRRNGASHLNRVPAVLQRDRELDPRVVVAKPGAPDDVRHLDDSPVREDRLPVLDADRSLEDTLDTGRFQIGPSHAQERAAVRPDLRLRLAPHRRGDGEHPRGHELD